MSDVLVIKSNAQLTKEQAERLYKRFTEQMNNGCVFLPCYCDAVVVPDGVVIAYDQETIIKAEEI